MVPKTTTLGTIDASSTHASSTHAVPAGRSTAGATTADAPTDAGTTTWSRHRTSRRRVTGLLLAAVIATGCGGSVDVAAEATAPSSVDGPRPTVVVHRTETCSCCGGYEEILAAAGYGVEQRMHDDLAPVRAELGVPEDQQSCHTLEIDGYAAEGHVPLEALDDLLTERPDVDGIALAGMPSGAPGMPGEQEAPFVVGLLRDGAVVGELGQY